MISTLRKAMESGRAAMPTCDGADATSVLRTVTVCPSAVTTAAEAAKDSASPDQYISLYFTVPDSVIVAAVGGSNIDSWNPVNGAKAKLHAARIVPLGPYALRGALWYQGCSNGNEGMTYATKLRALIANLEESLRQLG